MQKHRILLLTDAFTPPLRGQRVNAFAKNFIRMGHEVIIVNERLPRDSFEPDVPYMGVSYYPDHGKVKHIWRWILDKLFWHKDYLLMQAIEKHLDIANYDILFCSTFNTFPLSAARKLSHKYHLPLVVDLRDIAEQWGETNFYQHQTLGTIGRWIGKCYTLRCIKERNKALKFASCCTTVSPWHQEIIQQYNPNTRIVYNGYDKDVYYYKETPSDQFIISYIGRIYDFNMRDPRAALKAISELKKEGLVKSLEMRWHIEPSMIESLRQIVHEYGLDDVCKIGGFIPREEALVLLRQSSISLLLTHHQAKGIMTTKFFEAVGTETPILCTPSDEGCLAAVMRETNAGLASSHVGAIQSFILDKYHEWQQYRYTHQQILNKEQFSREKEAEQLATIMNDIRPILLSDICWTLYRSNTTFDFMDAVVHESGYLRLRRWMQKGWLRRINLGLLKLTRVDWFRTIALRYLYRHPQEEIQEQAELFVRTALEKKRIEAAWKMLDGREVILVSGTIQPIADAVGRLVGAKKVYCGDIFKGRALHEMGDYDIITDNLSDEKLIRHAHHAYIITYGNEQQWQNKRFNNISFLSDESERY